MAFSIEEISGIGFLPFLGCETFLEDEFFSRLKISKAQIENAKHSSGIYFFRSENLFSDFLTLLDFDNIDNIIEENRNFSAEFFKKPFWASLALQKPFLLHFDSISDAANGLKSILRGWAAFGNIFFRKKELILKKLPYLRKKPREFPFEIPKSQVGAFTLLSGNEILAFPRTFSPFPLGKIDFVEDKINPPSRAYLKLQEALCWAKFLGAELPNAKKKCFDAGASPGGWTWVLRKLGSKVLAVDRANLDSKFANDTEIDFLAHDAFTLLPQDLGAFDWVFSDVICYPKRLFLWMQRWIESGLVKNMICTIKLQGKIDWHEIENFKTLGGGKCRVLHLFNNKHELTAIWSKFF